MYRQLLRSRAVDTGIIIVSYFFALSAVLSTWMEHPESLNNILQSFFFGQLGLLFYFLAFRKPERAAREPVVAASDAEEAPADAEAQLVITIDEDG
jgi:hypothetical protein